MKAVKLQGQAHDGLCPPDERRLQVERVAKQLQDSAADDDSDETRQIQKKGAPVCPCRGTHPNPNLSNNLINTLEDPDENSS